MIDSVQGVELVEDKLTGDVLIVKLVDEPVGELFVVEDSV